MKCFSDSSLHLKTEVEKVDFKNFKTQGRLLESAQGCGDAARSSLSSSRIWNVTHLTGFPVMCAVLTGLKVSYLISFAHSFGLWLLLKTRD